MVNRKSEGMKMGVRQRSSILPIFITTVILALAMIVIGTNFSFAVGASNAIGGNVQVLSTCIPEVANALITFPSSAPGTFASTSNAENVINYGNAASNILVFGVNWIASTGNFMVGNTLWNPASGGNIGTQLTFTAVDTKIPMLANGGTNVIFFGLNIPTGQTAGTYNQLLTIEGSC